MTTHSPHVHDVTEATFARDVIERSRSVPVVVDFWAAWCGPCRMLGPVLERLAAGAAGAWELVKVDTDANQGLAARYRIQGIPAVKAFRDGAVVSEFTGALPEPQVRAWLAKLTPSTTERLIAEGKAAEERGNLVEAERAFREAHRQEPANAAATIGLARVLLAGGRDDEVARVLDGVGPLPEAEALRTRIRLRQAARGADFARLSADASANPRDPAAHLRLGLALAGDDAYTSALDHLLESVRLDRAHSGGAARKAMLELFTLLGEDDPRTRDYRGQLSKVLF